MRYGIPYQGSKSKIAPWVIEHLPASDMLIDLFAGGCAVTHCALLSGKWKRVLANDISDAPEVFRDAANGEYAGYDEVPTREEFNAQKAEDPGLALLYSFGNNRMDYLWGGKLEKVKRAASEMLSAPSLHQRRMHYKEFIKALIAYGMPQPRRDENGHGLQGLEGLERLQGLQGLEGLQGLQGLERLGVSHLDYRMIAPPENAVMYADPPYRGTDQTGYTVKFDHEAFDEWLGRVEYPVIVSEYTPPEWCVEIASIKRNQTLAANCCTERTERLFIQERFAEWYAGRMREPSLFDASGGME